MKKRKETLDDAARSIAELIEELKSKQSLADSIMGGVAKALPGIKVLNSLAAALSGVDGSRIQAQVEQMAADVAEFKKGWAREFEESKLKMSAMYLEMVSSRTALKNAMGECDKRYRRFGKKIGHAKDIRAALHANIKDRKWDESMELVDALLRLYDEADEKTGQE